MNNVHLKSLAIESFGRETRVFPLQLAKMLLFGSNKRAGALFRTLQFAHTQRWSLLAWWVERRMKFDYGCHIHPTADIGIGFKMPHPSGIVIGTGVVIGERCLIYQQVTLGGGKKGDWQANNYPTVGDDVTIFAGAKILGKVKIGDRAVIGANAVVIKDVPNDHYAVGVPAVARLQSSGSIGSVTPSGEKATSDLL